MNLKLFVGDKVGRDTHNEELIEQYLDFFVENFGKDIKENLKEDFVVRYRCSKWCYI